MGRKPNMANDDMLACITNALVRLAKEKPLSSISVAELCREAGVSRMSFYRNYRTKEDVLRARLDYLAAHYEDSMRELVSSGEVWSDLGHTSTFFIFMKANADFADCLFASGYTSMLVSTISGYMLDKWGDGTAEREYMLVGYAGLLCAAYGLWSGRGFQETPEQLAEMVRHPIPRGGAL